MLAVNFFTSQSDFENALSEAEFDPLNDVVYDLSSSNINFKEGFNVMHPVLDFNNITYDFLNDYEKCLKQFSKEIFQFSFSGYPLFWMTELSEKHPYNIPYRLFLIKNDILQFNQLVKQHNQVIVLLPAQKSPFKPVIERFFRKHLNCNLSLRFIKDSARKVNSFRYNWAYLRSEINKFNLLINNVREALKSTEADSSETNGYIFTYAPGTWNNESKKDYVIGYINEYAEKKLKYIPFIHDKNSFNTVANFKLPAEFVSCFPSKTQTLKFFLQYFKLFLKLKNTAAKKNDPFIETALWQMEVVLDDKLCMLFYRTWLINFFRSIKQPVNLFYQDEFYLTGRIISDAAKLNSKIKANGVQHGLIFANHAVYFVVKEEINGEFKLPTPDRLLVWGEYFKEVMKKHSNYPPEKIIVTGNLKYKTVQGLHGKDNGEVVLLWCTGLAGVIGKESKFVKEILSFIPECKVVVRMHPLHNVEREVKSSQCYNEFKQKISFSKNSDIQLDLAEATMVLSTSSSGVVLESAFAGKIVIAIPSDFYIIEKINHPAIFQPQSINDMSAVLPQITKAINDNCGQDIESLNKIVYTKPDVLNKVLNFEISN